MHQSVEGYDKWGIEILVSYRDGEGLDVLTGSKQSGGVSLFPEGLSIKLKVVGTFARYYHLFDVIIGNVKNAFLTS